MAELFSNDHLERMLGVYEFDNHAKVFAINNSPISFDLVAVHEFTHYQLTVVFEQSVDADFFPLGRGNRPTRNSMISFTSESSSTDCSNRTQLTVSTGYGVMARTQIKLLPLFKEIIGEEKSKELASSIISQMWNTQEGCATSIQLLRARLLGGIESGSMDGGHEKLMAIYNILPDSYREAFHPYAAFINNMLILLCQISPLNQGGELRPCLL
jgi:hypothetical protein